MNIENDNIMNIDHVENKQQLNEQAEELRIEEWMECWKNKKFPHGKEYEDYSSWKRFYEFWNLVYPELPLKVAHQIYLLKQKQENVK